MRKLSKLFLSFALFTVSLNTYATSYYGSGSYKDIGLTLKYDDNLSRAQQKSDITEDFITQFSAAYSKQTIINQNSLLRAKVQANFSRYDQYKDLNRLSLDGNLSYIYQPSTGYGKPWYEATVSLGAEEHRNSDIRDSVNLGLGAIAAKRFSRNILARIGYYYDQRFSEEKVFDTESHSLQTDGEYQLFKGINLYSAYRISVGDVVSTATPNQTIIAAAESVAPDDVFTLGLGPMCMNRRCAYRLDALTHQFTLGLNIQIADQLVFDVASKYHNTNAEGDNEYEGMIHQASVWLGF